MVLRVIAAPFPCEAPFQVVFSAAAKQIILVGGAKGDGKVWRAGRRRRFVPLSEECFSCMLELG